jgi:hypothetical protein
MLHEGTLESQRFGLRLFRGSVEQLDERVLLEDILRNDVDVAIVRLLREGNDQLHRLQRLGLPFIVADTLVYYTCDLTKYEPGALKNTDVEFVECGPQHTADVEGLVDASFSDYKNHYSSNPLLDTSGLLAGYKEWTRGYITGKNPHKRAWLVRAGEQAVGFATCGFEGDTSEGVLYGVHPAHAGRGLYGDIIKFTQRMSKELGMKKMKVSTQVGNFAVQKVWTRSGFWLSDAYLTVHVNALIAAKGEHGGTREVVFSEDEVRRLGEPGALAAAGIQRSFTETFPGAGAVVKQQSLNFLKPLKAGTPYRFQYAFHGRGRAAGEWLASVTVRDADGAVCLLSQSVVSKPA